MIPASPGTYVLVLRCSTRRSVHVGRIGVLRLTPGWYLYVGSAFGPGGLRARIGHHGRPSLRPHWHIDYIRRYMNLESVWFCCGWRREHEWARVLEAMPGAAAALGRFGSSDCKCATHLFRFETCPIRRGLTRLWEVVTTVDPPGGR